LRETRSLNTVGAMSATPDFYGILHVTPDAPAAIIHASYRTLLERARAAGQPAVDIAVLDAAYAVLGDRDRRAAYDAERARAARAPKRASASADASAAHSCLFCGAPHGLQRKIERDDQCGTCASPLCPAERHRLEYSGQRMINRVPKQRAVEIRVTWPQAAPFVGEMRDLSLNGMLFVAAVNLQPNQIVRVDCSELRALGRVAHVESGPDESGTVSTGIEFLTLRFWQQRGSFVSAEA
jgi:hypothetical protein